MDRDARIACDSVVFIADAANADLANDRALNKQARGQGREVFGILNPGTVERVPAERGDGDRYILHRFRAALRRDDDFLAFCRLVIFALLSSCWQGPTHGCDRS
jgi:hypothetical protein